MAAQPDRRSRCVNGTNGKLAKSSSEYIVSTGHFTRAIAVPATVLAKSVLAPRWDFLLHSDRRTLLNKGMNCEA